MIGINKLRCGALSLLNMRGERVFPRVGYFVNVSPFSISHIKVFRTEDLPVKGRSGVVGAFGGEWDRLKMPFKYHFIYRTIKKRMVNGCEWSETPLNRRRRRERGSDEIARENGEIDELIERLRADGYRSQFELGNRKNGPDWFEIGSLKVPPEIVIGMDRNGRLFQLANGRHRLAIAQMLGIKEMPAVLSVFHNLSGNKLPPKRREIRGQPDDFCSF